jgi:hypothetical protein
VDRRIKLRFKNSSRALTILARATGVEDKPQPANIQFNLVYERTPAQLLRELEQLGADETAKRDEATEVRETRATVKKFPINESREFSGGEIAP